MPSSITHELIADEARALLPDDVQELTERAPDYYFLGSQGPDLLFFYRPFRRGRNIGKYLHRGDIHRFFTAMLRASKNRTGEEADRCLAYALGYCSHYAADTVFHPFVYNYLRSHTRRFEHQQMEGDWDVYFLTRLRGIFPRPYSYPFNTRDLARAGILSHFVADCLKGVGKPLDLEDFERALVRYGRFLNFFHGRFRGGPLSAVERAFGFRGVSAFYPRETPDPRIVECDDFEQLAEGRGRNADELFTRAVRESAQLQSAFFRADELSRSLFRFNFEGEPVL